MNKAKTICTALLTLAALTTFALSAVAVEPNTATAAASFNEIPATPALLGQLRGGGFVPYLRHGYTHNSRPDRVPSVDLNDCGTQRPLTPEGLAVSVQVGAALRRAQVPIGEVRVSPLCRAKESAAAVLGPDRPYTVDPDLIHVAGIPFSLWSTRLP